jgi:hypothetical protein
MDAHQEFMPRRPNSIVRFAAAAAIAVGLGVLHDHERGARHPATLGPPAQ